MKALLLAACLSAFASSSSATVLLTDDFTVTSNSEDLNLQILNRQTGTEAPADYIAYNTQHQVGNAGTDVGQPGGAANSNYALLAYNSSFQSVIDLALAATGPLTVSYDMYLHGSYADGTTDDTTWGSMSMRALGDAWPIAGSGEFGMLIRANGGVQLFQDGGSGITPLGWDTPGFAPDSHWTFIFADFTGAGSAFDGNGSEVTVINGTTTLGTVQLGQLNSSDISLGFQDYEHRFIGIDNLAISTTVPEPSALLAISSTAGLAVLRRRR